MRSYKSIDYIFNEHLGKRSAYSEHQELSIEGIPKLTNSHKSIKLVGLVGGDGNKLVFGNNCSVKKALIRFEGSGSTIQFSDNCKINGIFIVRNNCLISLGDGTKVNSNQARFHCGEDNTRIVLGQGCLVADARFRTSDSHSIFDDAGHRTNFPANITVEDDVWLAEDTFVFKGAHVGAGSIVGARSTVYGRLPKHSLCVGTPAKPIKCPVYWSDELRDQR
ncbi:hypothetical protein [uncultured Salinicola sp.]|uniref:acyltransferase n=1 Tax=uncultured Salinicola sp. TaxID=1193542 RepID=UPI0026317245|nr:hypothetical protein [uncultured Salinicola sp.]